jgi:metal-responsive CopG/Arc/MetJ family transcriptional regulator
MATHKTKNKTNSTFSLSDDLVEEFNSVIREQCVNKSALVEKLIREWLLKQNHERSIQDSK